MKQRKKLKGINLSGKKKRVRESDLRVCLSEGTDMSVCLSVKVCLSV